MDPYGIVLEGIKCIQEEPAACNHFCPMYIDVIGFMKKVREGNFKGALRQYQRQVLFPEIISRICDEPCRGKCIRKGLEEPINIRLIERAICDYAGRKAITAYQIVAKQGRVAVIGAGLSGLSCALILARSGYQVTLYERSERMGGRIWEIDREVLPAQIIKEEFATVLDQENLEIISHSPITSLNSIEFDVLYVASDAAAQELDLITGEEEVQVNPISFESKVNGVFCEGYHLNKGKFSPIQAIALGRRVSRSIERYLKNASLTMDRENETQAPSRLYTSLTGREIKPAVPTQSNGTYSREAAMEEAKRCLLCECKECVKACEFLKSYGAYPGAYTREIATGLSTVEGIMVRTGVRQTVSCNLCGQCREICPENVDMAEVYLSARRLMHQRKKMPPAFYDFWIRDMQFSNDEAALNLQQKERKSCGYVFFPGCQLAASHAQNVIDAYTYLCNKIASGVAISLGCCGAPAYWSGDEETHHKVLDEIIATWESLDKPEMILACPYCIKLFKKFLPHIPIHSLFSIIDQYGLPAQTKNGEGRTISIFDPCASRDDVEAQRSVRKLLDKAGYRNEELLYHGQLAQCCSYGGLIHNTNPELEKEIIDKRIRQTENPFVTYCSNCRDTFVETGKVAWHILDILFGNADLAEALRPLPSLSQRRINRLDLKQELLSEIKGIKLQSNMIELESIQIVISDELREKMYRLRVLDENIINAIRYAQENDRELVNPQNHHHIAYYQDGIITYWVEYEVESKMKEYRISNLYCHRMQIEQE